MKLKLLIFTCFIHALSLLHVLGQVTAGFEADKTSGCSPLLVKFTNTSSGTGDLSYFWDFGNSNTSNLQNPTATYDQKGEYSVTLIVSNETGTDTLIKNNFVVVYGDPQPDFEIEAGDNGCVPLTVTFRDKSSQANAAISQWLWDFGDGFTGQEQHPVHVYEKGGNFPVSLQVVDENGCQSAKYVAEYVDAFPLPEVNFEAKPGYICVPPLVVNFENTSTGNKPFDYQWDFGDGNTSSEQHPVHTYNSNDLYHISLEITDKNGCQNELTKDNHVQIDAVIAAFDLKRDTLCTNENLNITNKSERAAEYLWNFGDGATSDQKSPKHSYETGSAYKITLTAKRGDCIHTTGKNIFVEEVKADFSTSPTYGCEVPLDIRYTDKSHNATEWSWEFGNGQKSTEKNPVVTYEYTTALRKERQEKYTDILTVTSPHGCTDKKEKTDNVAIYLPAAGFTISPTSKGGCSPMTFELTNTSEFNSPVEDINHLSWSLGDGNVATGQHVEHTYTEPGEYDTELVLTTDRGCTATFLDAVEVGTPQVADFEINGSDTYCGSEEVAFKNLSYDKELIDSWVWNFGDGGRSTNEEPIHSFLDTGYLEVTLTAGYNKCYATATKEDIVYINPPIATFKASSNCNDPYTYTFKSAMKGVDQFTWNYGDGTINSSDENPVHTFTQTGDYNVVLESGNNSTGCTYRFEKLIQVRDINAEIQADTLLGCPGLGVSFNGEFSVDEAKFKYNNQRKTYLWNFGDGKEAFTDDPVEHTFSRRGTYEVQLVVSDIHGCTDTSHTHIRIYQPSPSFELDTVIGCMPATASFINTSVSDTLVQSQLWDFGDERSSEENEPIHVYDQYGRYDVSLTLTDILGCEKKIKRNDFVEALKPVPDFSVTDSTLCVGDSATLFLLEFQDDLQSFTWTINDTSVSTEARPSFDFPKSGFFDAHLKLVDIRGCDSSAGKSEFIYVQKYPKANFQSDITKSNCYPQLVNFQDISESDTPVTSWDWDFGRDEAGSDIQHPEHNYTMPGIYDISLTASTSNSCKDTITKIQYLDIGGPFAEFDIPDSTCKGTETEFSIQNKINVYDFTWDFGDGATSKESTINHAYHKYGTIYPSLLLYADNKHTCDKLIRDSVYIFELIPGFTASDTVACVPAELSFTNTTTGASGWQWTTGSHQAQNSDVFTHFYENPGTYYVNLRVQNDFSCKDSLDKKIIIHPLPAITSSQDTIICYGNSTQLLATGGIEYSWTPSGGLDNPDLQNPVASPDFTTIFKVTGTDTNGCTNQALTTIKVQQIPEIEMNQDTAVIIGETIQLYAFSQENASYAWSPDTNLTCSTCQQPLTSRLTEPVTYIVTVGDSLGCFEVSDDVFVDIIREYTIDLPDAFTPNDDGHNDKIFVRGWGIKRLLTFEVYNRFGELVFSTSDLNEGWDGTYKGEPQNIETYIYNVRGEYYNGEIFSKTGNFHVIK